MSSSDSHEIYSPLKSLNEKQVSEENQKEMVIDNREEVDINALFEKTVIEEKMEFQSSVDHYSEDNETNRKQRHDILRKIRITRGLSLILILLILLFFIGMIATIIGAVYMSNEESELNSIREHHSTVEALVEPNPIQSIIEPNGSVDGHIDLTLDLSDVIVDSNKLKQIPIQTAPTPPPKTERTTATTPTTTQYNMFERQLEVLAPDSSMSRFLDRLRNSRDEFKLQDIPPAVDDIMQYLRQVFQLPRIRFEYKK